jgi:hypothetical protein
MLIEGKEQQALFSGTEKRVSMKHPTIQPQVRAKQKSLEVFGDE